MGKTGPAGSGVHEKAPTAGARALTTEPRSGPVNQRSPVVESKVIPVTNGVSTGGTSPCARGGPGAMGMSETRPATSTTQTAPGVVESHIPTIGTAPPIAPQGPGGHAARGIVGETTHPG